jgi:hypothetical protein
MSSSSAGPGFLATRDRSISPSPASASGSGGSHATGLAGWCRHPSPAAFPAAAGRWCTLGARPSSPRPRHGRPAPPAAPAIRQQQARGPWRRSRYPSGRHPPQQALTPREDNQATPGNPAAARAEPPDEHRHRDLRGNKPERVVADRRRDRQVILRRQRKQRLPTRQSAGHRCRHVLLPGRDLQPPPIAAASRCLRSPLWSMNERTCFFGARGAG